MTRVRLSPEDRRAQIIAVTSKLIASEGVDSVRVPRIAQEAGVTRPVVYRFFEGRVGLVRAVVEEFREELYRRAPAGFDSPDVDLRDMVHQFVEAACGAIEACGPGGWQLLMAGGPDPELDATVREMREKLSEPWLGSIERLTALSSGDSLLISDMLIVSAGEIITRWSGGSITRERAAQFLERTVMALLSEFSGDDMRSSTE